MDTVKKNISEKFQLSGKWWEQAKRLKVKFPTLIDSDLKFEVGKENELVDRIAHRLEKKAEEVIVIIKDNILKKV